VQVGRELLGGAGGVGAYQHRHPPVGVPAPQRGRELGQRGITYRDVIDRRVRPGLARAQHLGQRLPGPAHAVIGEGEQRVKPERAPVD